MSSIVIAITGASAMQIGERSIQLLLENNIDRKSLIIAHKVLNGLNRNEVFFSNKNTKNISFFEKFFSFFN